MTSIAAPEPYPVTLDAEWPERQSRWKTLLRLPLAIPAFLFSVLAFYGLVFILPLMWLAILVRGRIPRWMFDFVVGANRFYVRVQAYLSLLTDVYPAFDGPYPVTYDVVYPARVSRWQVVVWKLATALPQLIVVQLLQFAAYAVVAVGWLAILFTGQFPKGLHVFVVEVMRWRERVVAYTLSLTDAYPPYSLSADAPATKGGALMASRAIGGLAVAAAVAGITACAVTQPFNGEEKVVEVSYAQLTRGELDPRDAELSVNGTRIVLVSAVDPADESFSFYEPDPGYRLVAFSLFLTNERAGSDDYDNGRYVYGNDFKLDDIVGDRRTPLVAVVDRRAPPVRIDEGTSVFADVVFEVPVETDPVELSFDRGGGWFSDTAIFRFR